MRLFGWLAVGCVLALTAPAHAGDDKGPGKLELRGAERRLEQFEAKVKRMRGQPFRMGFTEKEALKRILALKKKYPENAAVRALFERGRRALMASKGEMMQLPADVLAYRDNEKRLAETFRKVADQEWAAYRTQLEASGTLIPAFPPPLHDETPLEELLGKRVLLDRFEYPTRQFSSMGRDYVAVGSGVRGYYYVELSNRSWLGAYEAVKRYRRRINSDVPEGMRWTVVARITGLEVMVPHAGKKKGPYLAHWGWLATPVAIHVPGRTFATADAKLELGGSFAGEARMEALKRAFYTVTSIPEDVTPERLTEIFVTAIKEKNYPLYLDCIDPARRKTPRALDRIQYHWDWHQTRFRSWYCHVIVGKAKVRILKGDTSDEDIERAFLSQEDKDKIKKHSGETVREAQLTTQAFDEKGKQYGSPKPRFFKKTGDGRWYITNYPQPF